MSEAQQRPEKVYITFQTEDDIIRFVNTCRKYDDSIDVRTGKMSTDAKSILGMLLMELGRPVAIDYGCYDEEDNYQEFLKEIVKDFDIKVMSGPGTASAGL